MPRLPTLLVCLSLSLPVLGLVTACGDESSGEPPSADACGPIGKDEYTQEEVNYFTEIALGAEYETDTEEVRKWTEDVGVKVFGSPTEEDRRTVREVVNELDALISPIDIRIVDGNPSIDIYFVPQSKFEEYELKDLEYRPGNDGFFWTWWKNCEINTGRVLVSSTGLTQTERSHLLREELTQTFGLMHDSKTCEASIFQQEWTNVTSYAPIDTVLIKTLYRPELKPCMTEDEVARTLKSLSK
jgi:hypothetical protein